MHYISPFRMHRAVLQLQHSAILAYPTEAVYGLGCDPLNEDTVLRLDVEIIDHCSSTWPGPCTWVIPVQDWVPQWLTGEHRSLAARISAHSCVQRLCERFGGPIVSTSTNPGGKLPALNARQVRNYFPREVSIFNENTDGLKTVTPIFDAVTGQSLR